MTPSRGAISKAARRKPQKSEDYQKTELKLNYKYPFTSIKLGLPVDQDD